MPREKPREKPRARPATGRRAVAQAAACIEPHAPDVAAVRAVIDLRGHHAVVRVAARHKGVSSRVVSARAGPLCPTVARPPATAPSRQSADLQGSLRQGSLTSTYSMRSSFLRMPAGHSEQKQPSLVRPYSLHGATKGNRLTSMQKQPRSSSPMSPLPRPGRSLRLTRGSQTQKACTRNRK